MKVFGTDDFIITSYENILKRSKIHDISINRPVITSLSFLKDKSYFMAHYIHIKSSILILSWKTASRSLDYNFDQNIKLLYLYHSTIIYLESARYKLSNELLHGHSSSVFRISLQRTIGRFMKKSKPTWLIESMKIKLTKKHRKCNLEHTERKTRDLVHSAVIAIKFSFLKHMDISWLSDSLWRKG